MADDTGKKDEGSACGCGGGSCCSGPGRWIWIVLGVAVVGVLIAKNAGQKEAPLATPAVGGTPAAVEKAGAQPAAPEPARQGKALPRLVDLGGASCTMCKTMMPILDDIRKTYAGKLDVVFLDVWENPEAGKEYGVNLIPTQVFYDAQGKKVFRHEGFFSREDILAKWKELGVDLPPVATVVSIPIAICLFFMMYPIMVKIDFASVVKAGRSGTPVWLTLFVNWAIKPFTMYAIALMFLGFLFRGFIGAEATDLVKMPLGLDLDVGAKHGAGTVVLVEGVKMLQVPLWRSYLAGCILLGIAPCTAMVLVWGYLARGNDGLTLVMVAINSLSMPVLCGILGGFLLGVGRLPVPWQALLLSIGIYVALPLVCGYFSRKWIIQARGEAWFKDRFLHVLTPITIIALLTTLVLLFSFKGETILGNPLTILWIAIPLFIQTMLIFWLGYGWARLLKLPYRDAAPAAMIGASNHFVLTLRT